MLCIIYVIVLGIGLGMAGHLLERELPARWPRRWLWCVMIVLSVVVPATYRTQHATTIGGHATSDHDGHSSATLSGAFDREWIAHIDAYDSIINRAWLAASALLVCWGLMGAGRVVFALRNDRRAREQRGPIVVDGVPVVVTESMGPATVGVLRSRVVVPGWVLAMPQAQRQYVVRHEEEHRRAHDALLLFVASLTLLLLPWNVGLWWQLRRLQLAIEMDCDRRVVSALGDATAYGTLLLRVAEAASRGPRLQPAFLGRVGMLERRLTSLLSSVPRRRVVRVLAPVLAIAMLLATLSMPHPVLPTETGAAASLAGK